ncbi:hypothetical protein HAX54_030443 [Datura stramonium]|uniref:Uncharacterized protein n=1 Tax=Datura stramonium TaxID=4076 RepID=A0ABS8VAH4_DATST|nr:hypothetical protein [Datura stramonium]
MNVKDFCLIKFIGGNALNRIHRQIIGQAPSVHRMKRWLRYKALIHYHRPAFHRGSAGQDRRNAGVALYDPVSPIALCNQAKARPPPYLRAKERGKQGWPQPPTLEKLLSFSCPKYRGTILFPRGALSW